MGTPTDACRTGLSPGASALCGALTALAVLAICLSGLGFLGTAVAAQSLLANLKAHLAVASLALWVGAGLCGWRLVGAAGALAAAALVGAVIMETRYQPVEPAPAGAVTQDVLLFNIFSQNSRGADVAAFLTGADIDIAVILEAGPMAPQLERLAAVFPHHVGCDGADCDTLILSRAPILSAERLGPAHAPGGLLRVTVDTAGGPFTLFVAHWTRTFFASLRFDEATNTLRRILAFRRAGGGPHALVGDFNAAPWDPSLRRIIRRLDLRGAGRWTPTWPVGAGPFGIQIDHMFVPSGFGIVRFGRISDSLGSNHYGVRATLAMPTQ